MIIAQGQAVDIARRTAGNSGYDSEGMDVVSVVAHEQTFEVLLSDSGYARGGGLRVLVAKTTGEVMEATPQL